MRILIFSLKIIALVLLLAGLMYFPLTYLWPVVSMSSRTAGRAFPIGASLLEWTCIAWVMAPVGIRLLQAPRSAGVAAKASAQGRISIILAILATNGFWYMIQWGESTIKSASNIGQGFQLPMIDAIGSMLRVLPCIPAFIAFALLAAGHSGESERSEGSKFRELLRAFMPLHFGQDKEA
jgi:hypothetical protein